MSGGSNTSDLHRHPLPMCMHRHPHAIKNEIKSKHTTLWNKNSRKRRVSRLNWHISLCLQDHKVFLSPSCFIYDWVQSSCCCSILFCCIVTKQGKMDPPFLQIFFMSEKAFPRNFFMTSPLTTNRFCSVTILLWGAVRLRGLNTVNQFSYSSVDQNPRWVYSKVLLPSPSANLIDNHLLTVFSYHSLSFLCVYSWCLPLGSNFFIFKIDYLCWIKSCHNYLFFIGEYYLKMCHFFLLWNICFMMQRCVAFFYAAFV